MKAAQEKELPKPSLFVLYNSTFIVFLSTAIRIVTLILVQGPPQYKIVVCL